MTASATETPPDTPGRQAAPANAPPRRGFNLPHTPSSLGSPPVRVWILMWTLGLVALASSILVLQLPRAREIELFLLINRWAGNYPDAVWSSLTVLGETSLLLALLSPLLVWRPQALFAILAAVPLGGGMSYLMKRYFDAPRPSAVLDFTEFSVIGPVLHKASFPSGHSITVFAAAAALVVCLLGSRKTRWQVPRLTAGLIILLAIAAGVSRVAVGAHWPVDVLAGAGVGWLAGTAGAWFIFRFPDLWQTPRFRTLIGLALCATGMWLLNRPLDYPLGYFTIYVAAACSVLSVVDMFLRVGVER